MSRLTAKDLEARLVTVTRMGNWPTGPYPTLGQLSLESVHASRWNLSVIVRGTGEVNLVTGLTTREMWEFLGGMIAAYDAARFRSHWGLPHPSATRTDATPAA
jgi:hypothetical protein